MADTSRNSEEAADLSSWLKQPHRVAVDAKGYVWREFTEQGVNGDETWWSMAPVNPDNSPIPQPVTYYVPERVLAAVIDRCGKSEWIVCAEVLRIIIEAMRAEVSDG